MTPVDQLYVALKKAVYELNAIRARDGAPQLIHWDRGCALQTDACDPAYFNELVEECFTALGQYEANQ